MREAKAKDYWRKSYKTNKYSYIIDELNCNGIYGLDRIKFSKGIYAICGLNGAGKSTIISFLKDIMGVKLDEFDTKKVSNHIVTAKFLNHSQEYQNTENCRLIDYIEEDSICSFIDYKLAILNLDFFSQNCNLEELLEQYEDNILPSNEVTDLSYIVGKQYSSCTIIEVDDDESHPFFRVICSGIEYDSLSMGLGEHILFYIYWKVNNMTSEKILIIEEPESFISIKSQINLMNYLAKVSSEKGITVVISTHSPFILANIRRENICVISRYGANVTITYPKVHQQSLLKLGLTLRKRGIIYFEDEVARLFAENLLKYSSIYFIINDYNFEIAGSESEITSRLKFPISSAFEYQIIGIYDGDMTAKIEAQKDQIKCKYIFLPCEVGIETVFKRLLQTKLPEFCDKSRLEVERVVQALSYIDGNDSHDWLIDLTKELTISKSELVNILFQIWIIDEENQKLFDKFIEDVQSICLYD